MRSGSDSSLRAATGAALIALACLAARPALAETGGNGASGEATVDPATCAACHGADGNSMNPEWPSLAGQHRKYIIMQLNNYQEGLRENALMSAQAMPLTDADKEKLATYFASQAIEIGSISADEVAPGQSLYRGGDASAGLPACMSCHGPDGAGNAAAGYPALKGQKATYTANTLKAYRDGSRQSAEPYAGMMNTIAKRMSDAQIEAVAKYVSALH